MNYEDWEKEVPETIRADSLWKMTAYRLALFAADLGWHDVTGLLKDRRTRGLAEQLYEALGSIGANLAEGYSRGSGKDRARFYEYALGSARESRTWYYQGRHILEEAVLQHRLQLLSRVISLLLVTVPKQRGRTLREGKASYADDSEISLKLGEFTLDELRPLLHNIPLP